MTERPILFNGEMVRAILDGRKTQTRRVIRGLDPCWIAGKRPQWAEPEEWHFFDMADPNGTVGTMFRCPYGVPGDELWVRESHRFIVHPELWDCVEYRVDEAVIKPCGLTNEQGYRFSLMCDAEDNRWRPSIHMPRWASRIQLVVADVRVERVQEISRKDATAEGLRPGLDGLEHTCGRKFGNSQLAFQHLWDSINAKRGYSWDSNPWVWAVTFERKDI